MTIVNKIPCTIVTGFLGAGKTTLVRHVVENAKGRRLAILVNEFGDVGFDKSFLAACGVEGCTEDSIVELPNGCICCTVADDFVPALETLLDPRRAAGAHPDRDLRPRPAEAPGPGLPVAGDPLAGHRRRRRRGGRRAGGGGRRLRGGSRGAGRPARRRPVGRSRQPAGRGVRGPAPLRRPRRAQQGRPDRCRDPRPGPRRGRGAAAPRREGGRDRERRHRPARAARASAPRPRTISTPRPSHHGEGEDHDHDDFETVALPVRPAVTAGRPRGPRREGGRGRRASCGSRASPRSRASRCASWCRASAGASPTISTGPGGRASPATATLVVIGLKGFDQGAVAAALAG